MRLRLVVGSVVATALISAVACVVSIAGDLERIKEKVRHDFPTVRQVSTDALKARIERGEAAVLLDVREASEFAVSHLPGARRVDPSPLSLEPFQDLPKDREIVVYCSVGYRSSRLAEFLQANGYSNVENLEGSIFEWAEKGFPLVQGSHTVQKVHPYSRAWAWLVSESLRAYAPSEALPPEALPSEPAPGADREQASGHSQ